VSITAETVLCVQAWVGDSKLDVLFFFVVELAKMHVGAVVDIVHTIINSVSKGYYSEILSQLIVV